MVVLDDEVVLGALGAACRRHDGPVTVTELVWAWTADLWWDAVTDPNVAVDSTAIPHTPSRAELTRIRRRLTALRQQGYAGCDGTPLRWQPVKSSTTVLDDSSQATSLDWSSRKVGEAVSLGRGEGAILDG